MAMNNRRTLLGGLCLGSASFLLDPIARKLVGEAKGAAPAKRIVFVVGHNSLREMFYTCKSRGETDFDLTDVLAPLAPHKKELLLAYPLFHLPNSKGDVRATPSPSDQHGNGWGLLCGYDNLGAGSDARPGGVSLDRRLAKNLFSNDRLPWIGHGVGQPMGDNFGNGWGVPTVSCETPGQVVTGEPYPTKAFERYFGGPALPPGMTMENVAQHKRSVLDFIHSDAKRLADRLAAPERVKLDQYLTSLRTVERKLTALPAATTNCQSPQAPGAEDQDYLSRKETLPETLLESHADVIALAMACGLNHVAMLEVMAPRYPHYTTPDMTDNRIHDNHHADNYPYLQKIFRHEMEITSRLFTRFKEIPEGSGTMADNSVVLYLNDGGGQHHDGWFNHAMVMLGSASSTFKTGRLLKFEPRKRSLAQLLFSLSLAFGLQTQSYGHPTYFAGEFNELRA